MLSPAIYSIGQVFLGFEITQYTPLSELNATLIELIHLQTGAKVIHIANNDPENVFCILFQTLPRSSNGAPHILEHTVLCGSKKYPVKDPFFAMTRRSLHTFMNAFTGSDFTCYPASSQNEKDFYNLYDVYLDAVFYPKLRRLSFLQEGHRLGFENIENWTTSSLQFQGIVFNEMKGVFSSPEERLQHSIYRHLLPDLPYAYDSGGDPAVIPTLSYEELLSFHQEYYHPSRAIFYTYGNISLEKHLHFLEEKVLSDAAKLPPLAPLPRQKRFHSPLIAKEFYPEDKKQKGYLLISWLGCPISHQLEILALSLIESLWFETDASFLKKAILQSGYCDEVESEFDDDISETIFTIVCKEVDPKNQQKLEDLIFEKISEFCQTEVEEKRIEAALYQLEMERLEIGSSGYPYGLNLFFRSAILRAHGSDPKEGLLIHSLFSQLKEKLKDPTFLTNLIKTHFLDNPHRLHLTMLPDPLLAKKELEIEREKLKKIEESLKQEDRKKIFDETKELLAYQEESENQSIDCLPKIAIKDLSNLPQDFELTVHQNIYHHPVFTNHFTYAELSFPLAEFSFEELHFLPLISQLWTNVGVGKKSYEEALFEVEDITGGIFGALSIHVGEKVRPTFSLKAKSLDRKNIELLNLLGQFAKKPRFDEKKRILEWFAQHVSELEESKVRRALTDATKMALSGNSISSKLQNEWYGLPYSAFIEKLKKDKKGKWIEKLSSIAQKLTSTKPSLILSCSKEAYAHLEKMHFANILEGWDGSKKPWEITLDVSSISSQVHQIPATVAFTAMGLYTKTYSAPLLLSTEILTNTVLHKEIREKSGAYGSGANYTPSNGDFYFYAYRDPHLFQTIQTFERSIQKIARGDFTQEDLDEAKIGLIGTYDKPISPGSRASVAYSWLMSDRTYEKRKEFRQAILKATKEDVIRSIEENLIDQTKVFVSFLGKELWEKEKKHFSHPPLAHFS